MNGLGTEKRAFAQAQRVYGPADTGWNASSYTNGSIQLYGSGIDVSGYGMWSVFISTTAVGNSTLTLHIMQEVAETVELMNMPISGAVAGGGVVQHFTFGAIGSTVPVVPARLVKFGLMAAAGGPYTATIRCFGRGF